MKTILSLIILISLTPIATAAPGLFDILNRTAYNGSLDIVTEYREPDKTVHAHKHIQGWINITGFKNAVMYNKTLYINGYEKPTPVIKYWIRRKGISKKSVDYLKLTDRRIVNSNGITNVEYDVLLKWHSTTTIHNKDGSTSKSTSQKPLENLTLYTSVTTPQEYPELDDIPARIIIYNNSVNPHVDIHTPIQPFVTKTEYTYQNETITRFTMAGAASTGAVNLSECLYWHDDVDNMSSRNGLAILKFTNESGFNITDLTITA